MRLLEGTCQYDDPTLFLVRLRESETFACTIVRGDIETVQDYLCAGIDPDVYSLTGGFMLHIAPRSNQPKIVTLLLKYGSLPYEEDIASNTALILAFAHGDDNHTEINGFACYVIGHCNLKTVQACIDLGIDFNRTDR
ncbi:hypothetical protein N7537_005598 [Penicillium hordei]|uniref:Ankyrin repeat protein n=1 Tax=Penicillium hordei TaxID=40994 RepID=A0AAD6E5W0_9EURO|nr:uncharacterized protein N7537_005598 [Penicillium hordei]KAJ5602642.1 hypothetical protein N7537_005598 [Penicillium hordei]